MSFSLKYGDRVGICAPSGAFDRESFHRGVAVLKRMGFKVHVPSLIYETERYLAGTDRSRVKILHGLFEDPSIDAVFCARGGYGALRLLEHLDYRLIADHPKLLVGFSDITALLVTFCQRCALEMIHGPVVTTLGCASHKTQRDLYRCLTGTLFGSGESVSEGEIHNVTKSKERLDAAFHDPYRHVFSDAVIWREGEAEGILIGGNLATLCHLSGTPFQPDFKNCILLLEDIGEPPYKIDRMLTQMRLTGMLDGVRGLLLGSFVDCGEYGVIRKVIMEIFDCEEIPIMAALDVGHGDENRALRMGVSMKMDTTSQSLTHASTNF